MTTGELAELVRDMRAAQKRYFRDRTSEALHASKELESRVDRVLRDLADPPAPGLFDGPLLTPEAPDKP